MTGLKLVHAGRIAGSRTAWTRWEYRLRMWLGNAIEDGGRRLGQAIRLPCCYLYAGAPLAAGALLHTTEEDDEADE